jgi:hypothetical protein
LFTIAAAILLLCIAIYFVAGWIVVAAMLIFPSSEPRLKPLVDGMHKVLAPIIKYAAIVAGVLLLIGFLASILGWGPPLPEGDPGDRSRP